ncbi:MAG: S49 family peptidase [Nanopusillaceae archaeon]
MKHLKYYIYQLLQKTKKYNKIFFLIIILLFLTFYFYFTDLFFIKNKYKFLVIHIDTLISSENLDIDSLIREIKKQDYYGIILKVSSSGGNIEVLRIVNSLKEVNKTKICYIDGLATSAAYWICSITDYIIARPDSIVGNIGAYITIIDFTGFLRKIGVNITIIKSTPYKDIGSPYRELSDFEREHLKNLLNFLTEKFVEDLKSKRSNISDLALSGLWFIAEDAKKYNLIDEIGEFERVNSYIIERFNLSEDKIVFKNVYFRRRKSSFLDLFFNLLYNPLLEKIFI